MPVLLLIWQIAVISLVLWMLHTQWQIRYRRPLPPGPKPFYIVGNLYQLPRVDPFKRYGEWSKIYGPLVYFRVFGREFIVLNTFKAALDLFEHRSLIYSRKPRMIMAGELIEKEKYSMVFSKYDTRLKECRRITHSWMGKQSILLSLQQQEYGVLKLLGSLLDDRLNFSKHVRRHAGAVLLKLIYGIECLETDDPHIALSEHVCSLTAEAMRPGRWLCDSFPILSYVPTWFPGAHFRRWAEQTRKVTMQLIRQPFEAVRKAVMDGTAPPSWLANDLLDVTGSNANHEGLENLMVAAGTLYAAGIDTTVAAIRTFFMMMARYPNIQRKAQAEIDSVVLENRLPTLSDRDSLPYIRCLIKEVLRIGSIVPILPHSLDTDDIYEGYLIPKGSWVMVNAWHIFHDPANYPSPHDFRPERFDGSDGAVQPDPELICFGLGRRTCAGLHFAQSWIFLNVAQILYSFDIKPVEAHDGEPPYFQAGHIRSPADFECHVLPRSQVKEKLIRELLDRDV